MSDDAYEGWCVLELMGHRRLAGYVRTEDIAGQAFLRLDVPAVEGHAAATQFYAPAAVYCITPTTEAIVQGFAKASRPAPVQRWELPALGAKRADGALDVEFEEEAP
jgi:hypothetical protein